MHEPRPGQGESMTPRISTQLDHGQVRDGVLARLESWSGFAPLRKLLDRHPGVDCFVAGGAVRDVLLEAPPLPSDVDLFLGGSEASELIDALATAGTVRQGPFGSPRWAPAKGGSYADVIPIANFYNGLWRCEDIVDALNQFDFTCNAVALDLRSGAFYDPQNGARDACRRRMRAIRFDYPDEPIAPDSDLTRPAVLWFRLLHYATVRRLEIEPITLSWLRASRRHLENRDLFSATFFPLDSHAFAMLGEDGR
jgi:tRNA nucleotidyltransferase (CCA-adding enzyme)